jgi:RNA polymerase sigma-70 factor (ECF subfamily)
LFLRLTYRGGKKDPDQMNDQDIITRYKEDQDTEWIGVLFKRYTHLVFGVCMKYLKNEEDAKDAVMQVFENLIHRLLDHEVENFKSWLYTITRNHCLMQIRKQQTASKYRVFELSRLHESIMESAETMHLNNERELEQVFERLSDGIKMLSEEQSKCIELMYLKEKSYREIAEITGYDLKQVKSYIQNGKRNLQKILQKGHG